MASTAPLLTLLGAGLLALTLTGCSGDKATGAISSTRAPENRPGATASPSGGESAGSAAGSRPRGGDKSGGKRPPAGSRDPRSDGGGSSGSSGSSSAGSGARFSVSGVAKTSGAKVKKSSSSIVTTLPSDSCTLVTATPLVLDDYVVFPSHRQEGIGGSKGCGKGAEGLGLFAVSAKTGDAYTLMEGIDGEAVPTWADGALYVPLIGGSSASSGIALWQDGKGRIEAPARIGMDSAALWDRSTRQLVVGTVNSPTPLCQSSSTNDCGVVMSLDANCKLKKRLDDDGGFRAWVVAAPVTDGSYYYFGGGSALMDMKENMSNSPCTLVKSDKNLKLVGSYDDGEVSGCRNVGNLKSAPVGETPIVGGTLYAQYLGATDNKDVVPFVLLDTKTMKPKCRAEVPAPRDRSLAGFYQSPVVDEKGRAYFISNTSRGMQLIRVNTDCSYKELAKASSSNFSSPTLADDKYVLVADGGNLLVIDREDGSTVKKHALGSKAQVVGGPVISSAGVSVVSGDNTVTTLISTGISGYGRAPWPRFRRDNEGSASGR